ncbi:hypothetical protein T459_32366 [Capsicum annuum]|uniref:Non-haem dioxygenase N-terminal domain-containing protein n=1 Tax=Capsicum annuum TaxID=4072 RepID=A0A2G2Y259_CAPAN|nr:hypothetical protein T459_32366 [Capsicum annuum]
MDIDCMNSNGKSSMLDEGKPLIFDASHMKHDSKIPIQFIWPDDEKPCVVAQELSVPLIDLKGFFSGDPVIAQQLSRLVDEACRSHGFFLVLNHGVDANLISNAHSYLDAFFDLPALKSKKLRGILVSILAMPADLLKGFHQSFLGKRHSLFDTLLKKAHLT